MFAYEELSSGRKNNESFDTDKDQDQDHNDSFFEDIKTWIVLNFGGSGIHFFPSSIFEYYEFLEKMTSSYWFRFRKFYTEKSVDELVNDLEEWIVFNLAGDGINILPKKLEEFLDFLQKINSSNVAKKLYELVIKYINKLKENFVNFIANARNFLMYSLS